MNPDTNLHVLVLAAGSASRFGSPKQLVRIGGQPLLHRAISQATQVGGRGRYRRCWVPMPRSLRRCSNTALRPS